MFLVMKWSKDTVDRRYGHCKFLPGNKELEKNVVESSGECSVNSSGTQNVGVGEVIDIGWFGSLEKLMRVTGYVARFAKKVLNKSEGRNRKLLLEVIQNFYG